VTNIHVQAYKATRQSVYLLLLLGGALGLRLWGITFGLPQTVHPDEYQYVEAGIAFQTGDLNPHRFNNPSLYKYILGGEYTLAQGIERLTGESWADSPTTSLSFYYLLGRFTGAVIGSLTVIALFRLGRRFSTWAAWLAALFLTCCYLAGRESHYAINDLLVTLLVVLTVHWALRLLSATSLSGSLVAGLLVGLAATTKYTGVFGFVPVAIAELVGLGSQGAGRTRDGPRIVIDLKRGVLTFGAALVAFVAGSPFVVLDWPKFVDDLADLNKRGVQGYKGIIQDPAGSWVFYLKTLNWGLGTGLLVLSLVGLLYLLWRGWRRRRVDELIVGSLPVALYLFLGRQQMFFSRFILPAIPCLCLAAAVLLADLAEALTTFRRSLAAAIPVVALLLVLQPGWRMIRLDRLLLQTDTRALAAAWIQGHLSPDTRMVSEPYGPQLDSPWAIQVTDTDGLWNRKSSLDTYRNNGTQVLITSSFISDRVLLDPQRQEQRVAFYRSVEQEATLLATFSPFPHTPPPFLFDDVYGPWVYLDERERPGPIIRIYRIAN
jgi:hypothetical protein